MKVYLDDSLVDSGFVHDGSTLQETLQHMQSHLCTPDRIVVSLRCDGSEVPANTLPETLKEPTTSFERIDVVTGTRGELVTEAMTQAAACLAETEDACRRVTDLLTKGDTAEAIETLGECLRIWQQVHQAVGESIEMMQLDSAVLRLNDLPLVEIIAKPKEVLLQVKEALTRQDYVLLADILEYEFGDVTQQWHEIVTLLRQEAQHAV